MCKHLSFSVSVWKGEIPQTHTHTHAQTLMRARTSCYASAGHRPGILLTNMIGKIPTLWASSLHIFWLSADFQAAFLLVLRCSGGLEEGEACMASSQDPSFFVRTIVEGRKLREALLYLGTKVSERRVLLFFFLNHWVIKAHDWEKPRKLFPIWLKV